MPISNCCDEPVAELELCADFRCEVARYLQVDCPIPERPSFLEGFGSKAHARETIGLKCCGNQWSRKQRDKPFLGTDREGSLQDGKIDTCILWANHLLHFTCQRVNAISRGKST